MKNFRRKNNNVRRSRRTRKSAVRILLALLLITLVFYIITLVAPRIFSDYFVALDSLQRSSEPTPVELEISESDKPQNVDVQPVSEVENEVSASPKTTSRAKTEKNKKKVSGRGNSGVLQQQKINLPRGNAENQIVEHKVFTLAYADEYEQAEWVFYLLTQELQRGQSLKRKNFVVDKRVDLGSAESSDYSGSGYDRGHLCPAGDIRSDAEAHRETFLMSNMSPQIHAFNSGVWNDLENDIRRWVQSHDSIYVATGPVLRTGLPTIGKRNRVAVPEQYYKILYSPHDGGHMIAFLMPNKGTNRKPSDFIVAVDAIEELTGIDFFSGIQKEAALESRLGDITWWK